MRNILRESWATYRRHVLVIVAVVAVVWTPLELLSSYMDFFVFGEDDFRKSWKFAQFLENFFGIIATAGVIFIGSSARDGQVPRFGPAIAAGFDAWARMWWTRFLTALVTLLGFIFLVVPGVFLMVRFSLVEPVTVQERISGLAAMRRSYDLTAGRFWLVFRLALALAAILVLPLLAVALPGILIQSLDHWLIDAAFQLVFDGVMAFATVVFATVYSQFRSELVVASSEAQG